MNDTVSEDVKLFVLSASLVKNEGIISLRNTMQGYRICATEAEAKDSFVVAVRETKPGFLVEQMLCMEVPPDTIRTYLAATKPPLADVTVKAPDDVVALLLSKGLKPEEIAVGSAAREARINELIYWFARYFKGSANPKWLASHAAELAYFIVTASPPMPGRGEGFVLVPVEPTEAMLSAGFDYCVNEWPDDECRQVLPEIYRAMLAASRQEDTHAE
jgi:hypothetical protein